MRKWVERAALEREGLVKPEGGTELDRHGSAAIATHIEAFKRSKLTEGRTPKHIDGTAAIIETTASECGWKHLTSINAEKLERLVSTRQAAQGKGGWTPRTAAKCIAAWRTFMRWCICDGRIEADPLARLKKPAPHRQRERRYLTVDEWRWLRASTEQGPERHGMTGHERALLYAVAIETGLRAGELAKLTRSHLSMTGSQPHILLNASETKNRRAARQYVRRPLAEALSAHAARLMPGSRVFNMPASTRTSAMIRADLSDARAGYIDQAGTDAHSRMERERSDFLAPEDHDGRYLDFHALRHTTGAWAAIGGASPKAIQTLMRHCTITLTLDTYGHLLPDEAATTVARMPDAEPIALRMTGTSQEPAHGGGMPAQVPATSPATRGRFEAIRGETMRVEPSLYALKPHEPVAESADAADLKSASCNGSEGSSPSGLIWVVHKETAQEGSRAVSILLSGEFLCLHCASKYV